MPTTSHPVSGPWQAPGELARSLGGDERRSTADLLWEVCRRHPDPRSIHAAVEAGADLGIAAGLAVHHRIGALMWRAFDTAGDLDALGRAGAWVGDLARVQLTEALVLIPRAVATALVPLLDSGLEPVVMKGPALSVRYPAPGLRPMEDIDVLLPREQHPRATKALVEAGWRIARPAGRDRYDTVFVHQRVPSVSLELHYGLEASHERTTAFDARELWETRVPVDCLGTPAFGLPLAEEIVSLCAHAGKPYHTFSRLIWIADLAMIVGHHVESGEEVDWTRVETLAAAGRCTTVIGAALTLGRRVGLEVPEDVIRLPTKGWRGSAMQRLSDVEWSLGDSAVPTFHLRYALTDGWWRRLRLLAGSGHGMTASRRLAWTVGAPVAAAERWWELSRRGISRTSRSPAPRRRASLAQDVATASVGGSTATRSTLEAAEPDHLRR